MPSDILLMVVVVVVVVVGDYGLLTLTAQLSTTVPPGSMVTTEH